MGRSHVYKVTCRTEKAVTASIFKKDNSKFRLNQNKKDNPELIQEVFRGKIKKATLLLKSHGPGKVQWVRHDRTLPGHIFLVQFLCSVSTPGHGRPLKLGGGWLHTRVLVSIPSSHVTEHSLQPVHKLQTPFT